LLEAFPDEAFKTNVVGTANVLKAARDASVDVFVNISTDKAADPTSILGLSKLVTERLTAGVNAPSQSRFVSVRFGNVLGSRGSVIDTFRYQIKKGGPVTVTDENVTRYFMTLSEAVHLVLQATVIGSDGETLVLDMGSPVKILDVAQHMIRRSGRDVEITFTGLRPGEKIHEILVATHESQDAPIHPLIWHTRATPLSLSEVDVAGQDPTRADLERLGRTSAHQAETSS
jgi:dTDP-glucose 4,6-dehydratase